MRNFELIFDTISVYNLPEMVRKEQVEKIFEEYGTIKRMVLKPDSGAAMAHVQYADEKSAKLAVDSTEKYNFHGFNLFVIEKNYGPHYYESFEYREPHVHKPRPLGSYIARPRPFKVPEAPKGSYKVIVEGLPVSGSWQDVKDHFRRANPLSSNVDHKGGAVLGFRSKWNAEKALDLDGTEFTSLFAQESAIISVREDSSNHHRDFQKRRSRSPQMFHKTIVNEKESRVSESSSEDPIDFDEILGL